MGMKKYEELRLSIFRLDATDILTISDNDYDNTGDWVGGWEDILGKLQ